MGRQLPTVESLAADQFTQPLQGLPPHRDVVIVAAGVAYRIPNLIEPVSFLQGNAQFPPVDKLHGLADVDVLAVGTIECQQLVDGCPFRKTKTVLDGRGGGKISVAAAQEVEVGDEIFRTRENITDLT